MRKLLDTLTSRRAGSCVAHAAGRVPVRLQLFSSRALSFLRLDLLMPHTSGRPPLMPGLKDRVRFMSAGKDPFRPHWPGSVPCTHMRSRGLACCHASCAVLEACSSRLQARPVKGCRPAGSEGQEESVA